MGAKASEADWGLAHELSCEYVFVSREADSCAGRDGTGAVGGDAN